MMPFFPLHVIKFCMIICHNNISLALLIKLVLKFLRESLAVPSTQTINNTRFTGSFRHIICHKVNSLGILFSHFINQIRPIERRPIRKRCLHPQNTNRIFDNLLIRCSRQSHERHIGIIPPQTPQLIIIRSKIVPPITQTMCLIHHKPTDQILPRQIFE